MGTTQGRSGIAVGEDGREHNCVTRRTLVMALSAAPLLGLPATTALGAEAAVEPMLDGAGPWHIVLDPDDVGVDRAWFATALSRNLELPGSLERQRIGQPVAPDTPWTAVVRPGYANDPAYARYREPGHVKVPFFLQPDTWYRGPVWYQRDVNLPADWRDRRVQLFLERPHWGTTVWIDDARIGTRNALHVPHEYDLGRLAPGKHRISIRVDNRMLIEIGPNSHGITDHTQGNWNGIVGRIELRATPSARIDRVDLYPDYDRRELRVRGRASRVAGERVATARVQFASKTVVTPIRWAAGTGTFDATISPDPGDTEARRPWDEFSPNLHDVRVELANGASWAGRFGWRKVEATADGFRINDRPAMFRGALECCIFPLTGHPPTDEESWAHVMRRAKAYGLNHLRFHSYCPPEAAFDAADKAGIYLQVETVWANQKDRSIRLGEGQPVDRWVYEETERVLAANGNHPSFVMMTPSNEPGDNREGEAKGRRDRYLTRYLEYFRPLDARRLWTAGAGWPTIAPSDYHITPKPRVQAAVSSRLNTAAPETMTDYRSFTSDFSVPVISHEIGQWCVYPNLAERPKYSGHLKPKNFDIFEDRLRDSGLLALAAQFVDASGRLQALCYKEDIESALRTPGMGGFQLLGLQDFPGQGTALVGVVDPFWDAKGYITEAEYTRFCAPTVPLARLKSRIARSGERFAFTIDVAHFGEAPLTHAVIGWQVVGSSGAELAAGQFEPREIPLGNAPLSLAAAPILRASNATAAKLRVTISVQGGVRHANDWDIWIYPSAPPVVARDQRLRVGNTIDTAMLNHLESGGTALIGLRPQFVTNYETQPVKLGFSSIFWSTLWTSRQPPTTLGILCDPAHPALAMFPTEACSNWQWWYLLNRAGALRLDGMPMGTTPIVRIIDDWFTARPLALIAEFAVGRGRAIVCGFEIAGDAAQDPVSQHLAASLRRYAAGSSFRPRTTISTEQLRRLESTEDQTLKAAIGNNE